MLNKIFTVVVVVAALGVGAYYFIQHRSQLKQEPAQQQQQTGSETPAPAATNDQTQTVASDTVVADFDTNAGKFTVTLDHKAAPKTVDNFVKLAKEGYYNGLKFHRILQDFVIQGGDPNSKDSDPSNDGYGGPGYTVPAEIGLKANKGAIAMASTAAGGPSSGSQFFIVTTESKDNHDLLDGKYTVFGYVTSGMDIVTKIAATPVEPNPDTMEPSIPLKPQIINKITIEESK